LRFSLKDKFSTESNGKVLFADERARALLADKLPQLAAPDRGDWQLVKHNASRTVYRGQVNGCWIYLKHYHSRTIVHQVGRLLGISDAKTEMRFRRLLTAGGVPTVNALAASCSMGSEWLATLAVEPAEPAHDWHLRHLQMGQAGQRRIRKTIINLARIVADMHAAGVIHGDLHAGNILIRTDTAQPECVLTDLHRMRRLPWVSRRARAKNLAQLLHDRIEFTTASQRLLFLKHYLAASGVGGTLRGWQLIIDQLAERHRRRLYRQRARRVFGNNRYFQRIRLPGGWSGHVVLASKRRLASSRAALLEFRAADWAEALARPDGLLSGQVTKIVKDSKSGLILRRKLIVGPHELDVMVKRRRRKKRWKVLLDCFRQAKSIRAFKLGHSLLERRIPTPLPLAALQRRIGPVLLDSILITEAHDGRNLERFLNEWLADTDKQENPLPADQRRQLAQQVLWHIGRLLQRLHDNNFKHRDLKSTNMLVDWAPGKVPEILLVDMDGLQQVPWLTMRRRFQALMRLNVSLLRCRAVNRAGQLRMLLGYLKRSGVGNLDFKPYWRMLENWSSKKLHEQIRSRRKRQKAKRR